MKSFVFSQQIDIDEQLQFSLHEELLEFNAVCSRIE